MRRRSGRRTWRALSAGAVIVATSLVAASGLANGRFPRAQRLVESEVDPNILALYGTYGLIVSRDQGVTWNHICEAATGTYTGEDPLLEILPDGRLLARTEIELVRSAGTWCHWDTVHSGIPNTVQDITRGPAAPMTVLALVGAYTPGKGHSSLFIQSTDGGSSWSAEKSLPLVTRGLSLDVAPSRSARVVVSGLDSGGTARLLVSDDGGGTWLGKLVPGVQSPSGAYLAAISRLDPNRFFVRTDRYTDINGIDTASDALLMTTDGGATWATLIERNAKLFGFALSPDESTLLVGYGDPVLAATYVEPADLGIYRVDMAAVLADPASASTRFEKIFDASVTCLRWTASGLYACTSQSERAFEVGRAPNASFTLADANPFTPLLELPKVRPLPCHAGTDGYACYGDPTNGFASVCEVFKASCDASAPPPPVGGSDSGVVPSTGGGGATNPSAGGTGGGTPGGGTPGAGGSASGAGGAPPSGAGQGTTGSAGAPASSNETASSSCGCRTVGAKDARGLESLLVVAAALVRRRRRGGQGVTPGEDYGGGGREC
jgi:MYXO-CTERM domain-containing protein